MTMIQHLVDLRIIGSTFLLTVHLAVQFS